MECDSTGLDALCQGSLVKRAAVRLRPRANPGGQILYGGRKTRRVRTQRIAENDPEEEST
jgi:hypothetical protein